MLMMPETLPTTVSVAVSMIAPEGLYAKGVASTCSASRTAATTKSLIGRPIDMEFPSPRTARVDPIGRRTSSLVASRRTTATLSMSTDFCMCGEPQAGTHAELHDEMGRLHDRAASRHGRAGLRHDGERHRRAGRLHPDAVA